MSDFEDLFEEPEQILDRTPKFYDSVYERPKGLGSISVQLVENHALWGNHLWNGGRWLSNYFDLNPDLVKGKSVLEFGAAAGLPSIMAALNDASQVIVTDYPDRALIDTLRVNLDRNVHGERRKRIQELGFLWGDSVEPLLAANVNKKFDVIILCDLLFNHSEHKKLLKNCQDALSPNGIIWCVFSHYVPRNAAKDLVFFDLAPEFGFRVEKLAEHKYEKVMFENDHGDPEVRRTCHIYQLIPL